MKLRNLFFRLSYRSPGLDTERYPPAVATSPTLKSRSLHLDASILISFHAIFLLLISIHEIRPCATAVAKAIGERARKREKEEEKIGRAHV